MKYRDHRGGFEESMKTVQVGLNADAILKHVHKTFSFFNLIEVDAIKFKYVGLDHRNEWNTYNVLMRLEGMSAFVVCGQMALEDNEYYCEACAGVFEMGRSDVEALQEYIEVWGAEYANSEESAIVCDDCFKKIDPKNNPEKVKEVLDEFYKKKN